MGFTLYSLKELDNSEGTAQLFTGDGELILHPRPNMSDPNDPLRWPKSKKFVCFFSVCSFAFLTNYAIGGLAPAFYPLAMEFRRTMTETSDLLLWPILVLGVFNFFWVPLANWIGKRPVFLFSTLLLAFAYLWGALAKTFDSLLWSNIVAAFAGSASEAVAASIVNDVFFLHERANLMGWYMNAIAAGNTIGPLICGFVVTHAGWRVHKWHAFGLVALNFLLVLFFVPETRYDRSFNESLPATPLQASRNSSTIFEDARSTQHGQVTIASDTKSAANISEKTASSSSMDIEQTYSPTRSTLPKKTFLQNLAPFSGPPHGNLLRLFLRPIPLVLYPAITVSFLIFAVSLGWSVAINILNSFVLQMPPYLMKAEINGLINIPGLLGNLLGSYIGGPLVDRYSAYCSKKNAGVFQPETRLHLLIVPALILPAGSLLFGYGAQNHLHWIALFIANGMVGVGLTAAATITMTYVSDAYLPVNADALTTVAGFKNIGAFGVLYGIVNWVQIAGYINAFGTQAGVYVAVCLLAVPIVIWGKEIRHITSSWRIIL